MVEDMENFFSDVEYSELLGKFIGLLKKLNYQKPIQLNFKLELEEYFKYKWENDKN